MIRYFFLVLCVCIYMLLFPPLNKCLSQEKIELKSADRLIGSTISGLSVREAIGNVYLTHKNIKVYCNSAIQYLDINKVELKGNVRIFQDTLSLFTTRAVYYGNEDRAICERGVILKDPNATLKADYGIYYFDENKAVFTGNVSIENPEYKITSNKLTYYRNTEDSFARENVIVTTDSAIIKAENIDFHKRLGKTFAFDKVTIEAGSSIIYCDSLTNYKFERKSIASGKVTIVNPEKQTTIKGNYLENYEQTQYSFVKGNASLIKIETDKENTNNVDTLFIYSNILESYRGHQEKYIATENVEIIRNLFSAKSEVAIYFKSTDNEYSNFYLHKKPIVWYDNYQMTGDSIFADIYKNKVKRIYAQKLDIPNSEESFLITLNKDSVFKERLDQIKGDNITIFFNEDKISTIEVSKNAYSIYFLYEEGKANGVNFSEGEKIKIFFNEEEKVSKVIVINNSSGKYVPENLLHTVSLKLAGFKLRTDRPFKK
ncbi:MAG: OstA-like protein [Ignavibacteria bacterium]